MKRKFLYALVTAAITAMSASTMAMTAFAEGEAAADTAATGQQQPTGMGVQLILSLVLMFVLLYFMAIRPQKKEQKRVQAMLAELAVGDTVLTTSGFYGVIIDINGDDVIVEFGNNKNCRIPMQKAAIVQIEKPEDAVEAADDK